MEHITIGNLPPERWQEFRDLRLVSLSSDPQAFGTSYEEKLLDQDETWREKLDQSLKDGNKSEVLFAFDSGKPIGIVALHRGQGSKMAHTAYLAGVYLKKEYRGKGIAEQMLQAGLEKLKAVGVEKVMLEVNIKQDKAVTLYKKLGFEIVGTLHNELKIDGVYTDEYMMERFLNT